MKASPLKKAAAAAVGALALTAAVAPVAEADPQPPRKRPIVAQRQPTIVDLALRTPQLSSLVAAVQYADANAGPDDPILADVLATGGPFTVFAPTNDAFARLLADVGATQLTDVPADVVRGILLDHVVAGELDAKDIVRPGKAPGTQTLGGLELRFGGGAVNGIPIAVTDVEGENGTVHVITGVLLES